MITVKFNFNKQFPAKIQKIDFENYNLPNKRNEVKNKKAIFVRNAAKKHLVLVDKNKKFDLGKGRFAHKISIAEEERYTLSAIMKILDTIKQIKGE